ncbi:MAG: hypothetical protein II023_10030, partial [Prevotella sp.]|nr:hypothetical protein [Prevotella sp.]
ERAERPERNNNRNNGRNNGNNNAHRNNNHNRNNNRNEMYHDPLAEHEPKDFNDSLDHDDMV